MTAQIQEEWRAIPTHEPYEASNMGRIRNGQGMILKPAKTCKKPQYLAVHIGGGRKASVKKVHRLVLMAFVGLPKDREIGCHKDDNQMNNKLSNLYWGTHKQNYADCARNGGNQYKFPKNNAYVFKARISGDIIERIKAEHRDGGINQKSLAHKYGVDPSYISYLVRGKRRAA